MLIDQAKAAAFKVQLVRQVVQGNSLAAFLCVRSLIEHRALAVWLPNQIGASLDAVASQAQATETLPQPARQAETALANFLAGQGRETKEERRAWIMTEQGGVRLAWLNLGNIVEAVFSGDDRFRKLYALSSAAMHGRSCRGIDLLLRAAETTTSAHRIGLLVLERLSNWDEEMDHLSAAAIASVRMEHAAAFGGAAAATTDRVAQQVFGHFKERSCQVLIIQEMVPRKTLFPSDLISNITRPRTRCSRSWGSIPVAQSASWIRTYPVIFATNGMGRTESTGSKRPSIECEPVHNQRMHTTLRRPCPVPSPSGQRFSFIKPKVSSRHRRS